MRKLLQQSLVPSLLILALYFWSAGAQDQTRAMVGPTLPSGCNTGSVFWLTSPTSTTMYYCNAGTWENQNGWVGNGGAGVPAGLVALRTTDGACPTGWTEVAGLASKFLLGTTDAANDAAGTGGANDITPAGTIAWPAGVPTNSGGAVNAHSGTAVADHASHTHTYTDVVAHTHVVTSQTATTGSATSYEHGTLDTSSAEAEVTEVTGSTGIATGTTAGPSAPLTHAVTQPANHVFTQPTVAWPAGVPTLTGTQFDNRPAFTKVIFCQKD